MNRLCLPWLPCGATAANGVPAAAADGPGWDHAGWADAMITTRENNMMWLDELTHGTLPTEPASRYPFSFLYDGKSGNGLLAGWTRQEGKAERGDGYTFRRTTWTDPETGLRLEWEVKRYDDFPAVDWLICFEHTGKADSPLLEDIQVLDLTLNAPLSDKTPYVLHCTNGAPSNPSDFEVRTETLRAGQAARLSGGGGRSSNRDFPFFKLETGAGSLIVAVGWSGQWAALLEPTSETALRLTAGMELTRFVLHPGERVRMPRMLILHHDGETQESNALFRRLLYRHYAAKRSGETPLPTLFCNTCFTRGGGWLNECNADNQISLINAYAPLGVEVLLTDAGWFEGGWPDGAGNWTPRRDAYPDGMGPVAAAAKAQGMIYGLWFEPERVVAGTQLHKQHPEWLLRSTDGEEGTYLLNFGLPQVQDYFFHIVAEFMQLPGFRVYRQDFNMDPLPYWRYSDAPDRQGIAEIRYIEGLYAYWDRIAQTWPDSFREECASGGRRIDLETLMRFHVHQKSDYWFDNEVDQASLFGLSQYLPNNTVVAHLNRLDDYSFHSTLASSLCLGWIADAPEFDTTRGKALLTRYGEIRQLLVGAWYPLLPYSRDPREWMAMQFHRPDLDEGLLLVFRRADSPHPRVELALRGLDGGGHYELRSDRTGAAETLSGRELMARLIVELPERPQSDLLVYRRIP